MYTPVYASLVYTPVYASLCMPVGACPAVHVRLEHAMSRYCTVVCHGFTLLATLLREVGTLLTLLSLPPREETSQTPRKPPRRAEKPDTESHFC